MNNLDKSNPIRKRKLILRNREILGEAKIPVKKRGNNPVKILKNEEGTVFDNVVIRIFSIK